MDRRWWTNFRFENAAPFAPGAVLIVISRCFAGGKRSRKTGARGQERNQWGRNGGNRFDPEKGVATKRVTTKRGHGGKVLLMATFYVIAPPEVKALADHVIERWHTRLREADVRIGYLFAHSDRDAAGHPKGPAIKGNGYPAAAQVRIVGLRDRVAGLPDALCIVDGDQWPDWTEERRRAVLDHELTHLHPTGDLDDANRPKLEMRLHDIQIGGFLEVIQRHEEQAIEHELLVGAGKAVRELTGKAWG